MTSLHLKNIVHTCIYIYFIIFADRYVSAILPPGNEDLKGDEADAIIKFKSALGLDDPDAAAMHMEVRKHETAYSRIQRS